MSRRRGKILCQRSQHSRAEKGEKVALIEGWRRGVKRVRAGEEVKKKRRMIFHSSRSLCGGQVCERIIKEVRDEQRGGCNDLLMTLPWNFVKRGLRQVLHEHLRTLDENYLDKLKSIRDYFLFSPTPCGTQKQGRLLSSSFDSFILACFEKQNHNSACLPFIFRHIFPKTEGWGM